MGQSSHYGSVDQTAKADAVLQTNESLRESLMPQSGSTDDKKFCHDIIFSRERFVIHSKRDGTLYSEEERKVMKTRGVSVLTCTCAENELKCYRSVMANISISVASAELTTMGVSENTTTADWSNLARFLKQRPYPLQ